MGQVMEVLKPKGQAGSEENCLTLQALGKCSTGPYEKIVKGRVMVVMVAPFVDDNRQSAQLSRRHTLITSPQEPIP